MFLMCVRWKCSFTIITVAIASNVDGGMFKFSGQHLKPCDDKLAILRVNFRQIRYQNITQLRAQLSLRLSRFTVNWQKHGVRDNHSHSGESMFASLIIPLRFSSRSLSSVRKCLCSIKSNCVEFKTRKMLDINFVYFPIIKNIQQLFCWLEIRKYPILNWVYNKHTRCAFGRLSHLFFSYMCHLHRPVMPSIVDHRYCHHRARTIARKLIFFSLSRVHVCLCVCAFGIVCGQLTFNNDHG